MYKCINLLTGKLLLKILTIFLILFTVIVTDNSQALVLKNNYFNKVQVNTVIAQNKQLGNQFYNQIPFVDIDSRLPPRDNPQYLRDRASGAVKIPGTQELIDPYIPLPSQQPPPILPYDQGVDLPVLQKIKDDKQERPVLDQSYLNNKAVNKNTNQNTAIYQGNSNLPPVPKAKENTAPQYGQEEINQIPLPPLVDELPQASYDNSSLTPKNQGSLPEPIQDNYSDYYVLPRADFTGDETNVDFYDLPDDVLDQGITQIPLEPESIKEVNNIPLQSVKSVKNRDSFALHLASYYNTSDAERGWKILIRSSKNAILGLKKIIVKVNIRGVTYYRLLAGSFQKIVHAERYCNKIINYKLYCNVMPVKK